MANTTIHSAGPTETVAYVLPGGDLVVAVNRNGRCVARQRLAAVPSCQGFRWQSIPTLEETSHAHDTHIPERPIAAPHH